MKTVIAGIISFILGVVIVGFAMMKMMPSMMFTKAESRYGFEETVDKLQKSARDAGWGVPFINDLQEHYINNGLEDMSKVTVLYFCDAQGGYAILKDDRNKPFSAMMPMGVSVYETSGGKVYISAMNIGMMSKMIGGTVQKVMGKGGDRYNQALEGIIKE